MSNCVVVQISPSTLKVPVFESDSTKKVQTVDYIRGICNLPKKCSDDSTWWSLHGEYCLINTGPYIWEGQKDVDGDIVTFLYQELNGPYEPYFEIKSATKFYFMSADAAGNPEFAKEDCGSTVQGRTVVAYSGQCYIPM